MSRATKPPLPALPVDPARAQEQVEQSARMRDLRGGRNWRAVILDTLGKSKCPLSRRELGAALGVSPQNVREKLVGLLASGAVVEIKRACGHTRNFYTLATSNGNKQ